MPLASTLRVTVPGSINTECWESLGGGVLLKIHRDERRKVEKMRE